MIYERPKNEIFASDAKTGEIVEFPNVKRGWGVTENLGFIPPMEYFNAAFNRVDKSLAYQLQRGIGEWSAEEEYPAGAVSVFNSKLYQAKATNTNKKPPDNKDAWDAIASETWSEQTFLKKTATAADSLKLGGLAADKYAKKDDIPATPQAATETEAGIVKLKNSITGNLSDTAVSEKAVFDAFSTGFLSSKQQNGYTKLSNGIILQWGRVKDLEQDARKNLTFPISFPNACLNASATYIADSSFSQAGGVMYVANITKTGMTIEYQTVDNDASNFPKRDAFWFAIGY